jgi:hypothetical protein
VRLSSLWYFLAGNGTAWALAAGARHSWPELGFFVVFAVGALVVPLRGMFGTAEDNRCRHGNRVEDGTASFRRARLELVKGGSNGR